METIGLVRRLDDLGRLVLPIGVRRRLAIAEKDDLEFFVEADRIILSKYVPACIFCGDKLGSEIFKGKFVCKECQSNLIQAATDAPSTRVTAKLQTPPPEGLAPSPSPEFRD